MSATLKPEAGRVVEIPVGKIKPDPNQPRKSIDEKTLKELAHSIESVGILQPITVREDKQSIVIVSGERRWRAAKLAKLKTVPCILVGQAIDDDVGRAAAQIAENVQRQSLDPMEIAKFLADLQKREGKSTNELLAALDKRGIRNVAHARVDKLVQFTLLPKWAQDRLRNGTLTESHAVHLLPVLDVPAVLEDLEARIDQELEWKGQITVKELQREIETAYRTVGIDLNASWPKNHVRAFPIETCKGCEHLKKLGGKQYCMNPAEFERKQKEAFDLQAQRDAERAERKASRGEDRDNPDPTKVKPRKLKMVDGIVVLKGRQYDTYKALSDGNFDVAGCAGCPHNFMASHTGDADSAEPTCFHLPCFAAKQQRGRVDERRAEKLATYLDAWLRPRLLEQAPARAAHVLRTGLKVWLATGGLHHSDYGIGLQRHSTVAEKTRQLLAKHRCRDFRDVIALGGDFMKDEALEADLVRCAIAVMDQEQLRWFGRELRFDLAAEGYVIDMDYLNLQRRDDLLKLAELGELEHARGSVKELKERILNTAGSRAKIGVPADLAALYAKPYPEPEAFDDNDEDFADDQSEAEDEQLAAALAGGGITPESIIHALHTGTPSADEAEHLETTCIVCGCTDREPCEPPCAWSVAIGDVGICSACITPKRLQRWEKGDRKLSRKAASAVRMRAEMHGVGA